EPTGNLDPELSAEIMNLFDRLNKVGITLLIASHDLALINTLPHRKVELRHGTVVNDHNGVSAND
ncbi:MAG: cell division ATP-binding protein FtsE, partial [Gammaproteobacteria bacterium]|nr:cell division ATP-binding protein FtsE [Gammaproteobacteria bacterium]